MCLSINKTWIAKNYLNKIWIRQQGSYEVKNVFVVTDYFVLSKRLPLIKKTFSANSFEQLECVILVNKFPNRIGFNWDYNLGHHMPQKPNPVMLMTDFLLTSMSFWPSPKKMLWLQSTEMLLFFFLATPSIFVLHLENYYLLTVDLKNELELNVILFHIYRPEESGF